MTFGTKKLPKLAKNSTNPDFFFFLYMVCPQNNISTWDFKFIKGGGGSKLCWQELV